MKGATKIHPSPKKFDLSSLEFQKTEVTQITLSQVDESEVFTIVDVRVKVVSCGESVTIGTRHKQEVQVADATERGIVELWEKNSYVVRGMML